MNNRDFQLGIICGGPSGERGISLNSARSVLDHLGHLDIYVYYVKLVQATSVIVLCLIQIYYWLRLLFLNV